MSEYPSTPERGNVPEWDGPSTFWERGSLKLIRHCDGVFELVCDGVQVMPIGSFERVNAYLWSEFYVMGDPDGETTTQH